MMYFAFKIVIKRHAPWRLGCDFYIDFHCFTTVSRLLFWHCFAADWVYFHAYRAWSGALHVW